MTRGNAQVLLKERKLALVLGLVAAAAAVVQLGLGGSPLVVVLALVAALFGLTGFIIRGAFNLGAWVAFFFVLGNVLIALYAKTLFGQPLDSNLYAPTLSFGALAFTSMALLMAIMLVSKIRVGRPILTPTRDPQFLFKFSWIVFGLGVLFWYLNRMFQDPSGSGFGGIALFRHLLFMGVIARTAALLEQSQGSKTVDMRLTLLVGVSCVLGFVDNTKTQVALPIASYLATLLFYRRGLPVRTLVIIVVTGLFFVSILFPIIHAFRAMGQKKLDLSERIEFITVNLESVLNKPDEMDDFRSQASAAFEGVHTNYFGGNGRGQMLLGRYASIQQIDPVIARASTRGAQGGDAIWPALLRLLPTFLYPDKPEHAEAFNTLVYYRFINPEGGKFPTLPLAGQAYAAYGLFGVLTIPFITFFCFLLVLKKLGWQLERNIYAIFFLCSFVLVYVNQGSFGQYAGAALRNFPLFTVVFLLVGRLCRVRWRLRREPRIHAERAPPRTKAIQPVAHKDQST